MSRCSNCEGRGKIDEMVTGGLWSCPVCHGTGEVVGNSEQLKSRSVQRREALQKGEPMPAFDKPEMPERFTNEFGELNAKFIDEAERMMARCKELQYYLDDYKMLLEEANKQIATLKERDRQNTEMIASMTDQLDASLDKEKVRELVESLDKWRHYAWDCIDGCKKQEQHFIDLNCDVESVIISLFPEGLGGEE